jgi:hypothetical protein
MKKGVGKLNMKTTWAFDKINYQLFYQLSVIFIIHIEIEII